MSTQLVPQADTEAPAVVISESAIVDAVADDESVWVVFPGEEPHWEVENWATDAIDNFPIPWWLILMWLAYGAWVVFYLVYGSSQW